MSTDADFFCADVSRQVEEALYGTLASVDVWFLLEYAGYWGAKAFDESELPEPVKRWLAYYLETIPRSRLQFIRQRPAHVTGPEYAFYAVLSRELEPKLYRFHLSTYDDLLTLDLSAVVSGDATYDAHLVSEPLFLVCTNGKRDRCCARYGLPVFNEMVKHAGDQVWQCTHIGGHRFAANLLCHPHGLAYGRVGVEDVGRIVEAYRRGHVVLDKYRGRACYEGPVQAADYFLRSRTGITELGHFRLLSEVTHSGESTWTIHFTSAVDNVTHRLQITKEKLPLSVYSSCGDTEPKPVTRYRLASYYALEAQSSGAK